MTTAAQAHRNKLDRLAEQMRNQVRSTNADTHKDLTDGLIIVVGRRDGQWRLALGREKVSPSQTEVDVCKRAFNVPEGASEDRREHSRRHPKTGRHIQYSIVELKWMEH